VVPVFDEAGRVAELYGRKITPGLRTGTPLHLYLTGPHRGVWNVEALQAHREVILCEALLDALTFWCAGYRNVTAAYGVEGVTPDHWKAFERTGTERVLIAYDRDEAGERAAEKLVKELALRGIGAYRIHFPRGMDANEYAQKVTPATKSLEILIRKAHWLGKGLAPAPSVPAAQEEGLRTQGRRRAHRIVAWVTRAEWAALGRLARAEGTSRSTAAARILARAL
jgi:DNA primase